MAVRDLFTAQLEPSFLFMSTLINPEQSYKHNLLPVCFNEHRWALCPQIFNFLVFVSVVFCPFMI